MPIKLRHKQTGREYNYSATVFFERKIQLIDFDILEWEDVVELFYDRSNPISIKKLEKRDAIKQIEANHTAGYWWEDVPRPKLQTISKPKVKKPAKIKPTKNILEAQPKQG